jgi:tetratricopeptide (TPR) repeat protein
MVGPLQSLVAPFAVIVVAACASGPQLSPRQTAARGHVEAAAPLLLVQRWDQAIVLLDSAVALDSTNVEAFQLRAVAKSNAEGFGLAAAIEDWDRALALRQTGPMYLTRGKLHLAAGNLDQAFTDCEEAYYYGMAEGGAPDLARELDRTGTLIARDPLFERLRREARECMQRARM